MVNRTEFIVPPSKATMASDSTALYEPPKKTMIASRKFRRYQSDNPKPSTPARIISG